jgi:hypothetical protein
VLDIQELREGREPWSKTKQPGSLGGVNAAQGSNTVTKSRATAPRLVKTQPRLSKPGQSPSRSAVENVFEKLNKLPFAAALLLAGVLVFGLQVRHFISAQKALATNPVSEKAAEPSAIAAEAPPMKQAAAAPVAKKLTVRAVNRPVSRAVRTPSTAGSPSPASAPAISPALLDIQVDHKFAEAHLTIWVDDRMSYTHLLEGADKKHMVVFHKVQGHEFHAMQVPLGKHRLRVRVESPVASYDQSGIVTGEFSADKEQMLRINFSKSGEMQLNLQ